ncbi:class C sortase [Pseudarthrobacter sp. PS3-L1]|uniref:class C sortase n=1 Tax=Pseudarthrobacter sp. PS3-L1 TaxID=3046207 RepID=UPI0024B988D8|nr:class C sortase [Pseudarthrobacter sp. PS3-L1]MDJ0319945.1 class C sortase [Pseudarthrobacter sp. PS3-L1]
MNTKAGHQFDAPPSLPFRHARSRKPRWRLPLLPLLVAIALTIGSALLLYPAAAAWFSSVEQSREIDKLTQDIKDLGAETLKTRLAEARDYNQRLSGGGADIAANERLPLANEPQPKTGRKYLDMLRGDSEGLMARIRIPSINVDLPIYHGTSNAVLEHGIGHLEGTALPVGGQSTHSVVTGHRGLATSDLFTNLDKVSVNDSFTIEVFGELLTYRVTETVIVEPEDTQSLLIQPGSDLMTLVTCTPLGINSHRILVTGERVIPTPQSDIDEAGKSPDVPGFPWWMFIAGGVVLASGTYVGFSGRPPRAKTPPVL